MNSRCLIVGAGFSGAVLARELAESGIASLVIDQRDHVAGNCHTSRDGETGIMEHAYGPHIFNTSNSLIWDYIGRFGEMRPYVNRVKASTPCGVFSLPINLLTINQFFGVQLNPDEAKHFIRGKGDASIREPRNFEEQALKFVGRELYENFFQGYTKKQWGCDPSELPADILNRLPIRFNYDDNYYHSKYQGIPAEGYTTIVKRILDHPDITVELSTPWETEMETDFPHIFFTGPLDAFFKFRLGRLGYRTVYWDRMVTKGDFQGNAVINYTDVKTPHTRVHEHKHFAPWEAHDETLIFTEYSKETRENDIPYYPKRLQSDKKLLFLYQELARNESKVFFLGRLATYRYLDMHVVIEEALSFAARFLQWRVNPKSPKPIFANEF